MRQDTVPKPEGCTLQNDRGTSSPRGRSRVYEGLDRVARTGIFALQQCEECEKVQYPPREICWNCLSDRLAFKKQTDEATLLAKTRIWRPYEPRFENRVPVAVGLVQLDAGPVALAMLDDDPAPLERLRLSLEFDADGHAVIRARKD